MIGFKARGEINDISKSLQNMSKWKRHFIMVRKIYTKMDKNGRALTREMLTYFFCDLSINHFRINGYGCECSDIYVG